MGNLLSGSKIGKSFSERYYLKIFLLCLVTASIMVIPFVIKAQGLFTTTDDFNVQQLPFNIISNQSIKTGDVFWNWYTDLGSQFIGAYSFYTLGSPFFWISLLFPASSFPFIVGPLLILKYCVAGVAAYAYIQRFVKNKNYAIIAALLYAFSGFQASNLLFNHFHDVVAFFPFLLIALEELVSSNRRGLLLCAVAINAVINYFFFIGEIIFLVIYFCVRWLIPDFKRNIKMLPKCIVEVLVGIGIAAVLFLPSILFVMDNPRTQTFNYGANGIAFSGDHYLNLLKSILMPGDVMNAPSVAYLAADNYNSTFAYLPLFGFSLVMAYLLREKKSWLTRMILVCIIIACIPFLNSIFYMFTASAYSRWFYMPILLFSLASAIVMERKEEFPINKGIIVTLILTVALVLYTCFYPWAEGVYGAVSRKLVFALYAAMAIAGIVLTAILFQKKRQGRLFYPIVLLLVVVFSVANGGVNIYLMQGKSNPQEAYAYNVKRAQEIKLPEDENYRVKTDWITDNFAEVNSIPSINTFSSTVNGSIFEFYEGLGVVRGVVSDSQQAGLRELFSVKYLVTVVKDEAKQEVTSYTDDFYTTYVYEYEDFIPLGFTYDYYMTEEQFASIQPELRGMALLKAIVVPDGKVEMVENSLELLPENQIAEITPEDMVQDVQARQKEASYYFDRYQEGFSARIKADSDKYAYFSVPYDKGWTAYVDGKEQEIINTNGMMAVAVKQGDNVLDFRYFPRGLKEGAMISIIAAGIAILYVIICRKKGRQKIKN